MRILSHEAPDVWYERVDGEIRIHETESDRVISAPMDMAMRVLMLRKPIMTEIARVIDHKERPCVICGNKFVSRFTKVSACSPECHEIQAKQRHKEYSDKRKTPRKATATKADKLAETAKAARDTGLTYGQYKAQETIEMYGRVKI